jgi:hypothetical protein
MTVIDLTHAITPDMPVYPGTEKPVFTPANSYEKDGFKETKISFFTHTGTHMDPPAHLYAGRTTLDQLPIDQFIGKALVIDVTHLKEGEMITMKEIEKYEDLPGKADFLLFNLGWDKKWGTDAYFGDYPCVDDEVLSYIANKNLPAISAFMSAHGLPFASAEAIADVTSLYLPLPAALPRLLPYVKNETMQAAYDALSALSDALKAWSIDCPVSFDASIAGDRNYYNGIVFSGYLDGIPSKVLSGGRYDSLLSKMGKYAQAIGFAVYPERIGLVSSEEDAYDVDACILYGKETDPADLIRAVNAIRETGVSVRAEEGIAPSARARAVYRMTGKEAQPV